jgi:hypothetical protein
MNKLKLFQWAVGACDACTGILLVLAPAWTLHLMGMVNRPSPVDTISFVGVFVMAVGVSYFLVSDEDVGGWKMQWKVTALVRLSVAGFLAWKIFASSGAGWETRWLSVLLTDLVIASVQIVGLKRKWLDNQ